jgi:hypothetical protein
MSSDEDDDRLSRLVLIDLFNALDDRILAGFWRTPSRANALQISIDRTFNHRGEETEGAAAYAPDQKLCFVVVNKALLRSTNRWAKGGFVTPF